MKLLLLLFLLIYGISSRACNQLNYYDLINRAEYHLVLNNYDSAILLYDLAFNSGCNLFAKDIHNYYRTLLIEGSLSCNIVYSTPIPFQVKLDCSDSSITLSNHKIDSGLRNKVMEFRNRDQFFAIKRNEFLDKDESIAKRYSDSLLLNAEKFLIFYKELLSSGNNLSESKIGLYDQKDPLHHIISMHLIQYGRFEILDLLENEVLNGNYPPKYYAYLIDLKRQSTIEPPKYGVNVLSIIKGDYKSDSIITDYPKELEIIMDNDRSKIGLEPLSEYKLKIQKELFDFGIFGGVTILSMKN